MKSKKTSHIMVPAVLAAVLMLFFACGEANAWNSFGGGREHHDRKKHSYRKKPKQGLGLLMDFGKSAVDMQKDVNRETENFEKARSALDSGKLEKGMSASEIEKITGEPSVKTNAEGSTERWVYKKGSSSYFEGDKVYLYFDNAVLSGYKYIPAKNGKEQGSGKK